MKRLIAGLALGALAGGVFLLLMIKWPQYFAYNMMLSAFCSKVVMGYVLGLCSLRSRPLLWGMATGIMVSLPEAVAFNEGLLSILAYGAVAGALINLALVRIK